MMMGVCKCKVSHSFVKYAHPELQNIYQKLVDNVWIKTSELG
jgi:hypothetical protein